LNPTEADLEKLPAKLLDTTDFEVDKKEWTIANSGEFPS
jgi:hypothetical protein